MVESETMRESGVEVNLTMLFCKDVLYPATGDAILNALERPFPSGFWNYESWELAEPGLHGVVKRKKLSKPRVLTRDQFLLTHWNRDSYKPDSHWAIHCFVSMDSQISIMFSFKSQGGSRALHKNPGGVKFWPSRINLTVRDMGVQLGYVERLVPIVCDLSQIVEASYSYCGIWDDCIGQRLDLQLEGVRWITQFGPDLVGLLGPTRFIDLPVHDTRKLDDGGIAVVLYPTFAEYLASDRIARQREIERMLGAGWFAEGSPISTEWPKLRNLRFPDDGP